MSHSNNNGRALAENVEGRPLNQENTRPPRTQPTQSEVRVSQGLAGVRKAAKQHQKMRFTALLHHLTVDLLRESFYALKRKAAPGIDGVTWQEYQTGLEGRLIDLHGRVHRGAFRAHPSRRVYIRKDDGRQRPLGIAALEDKIVQQAVVTILNAIYEEDFLGFSYGFRPGRSQHQALDALTAALTQKHVNYILDADIRGFFDSISHGWMLKFVQHRVADRRILRLIQKWLKAGVMEEGEWSKTEKGTPQGAVISPLLANIYLHYVFDLWVHAWRKKHARGDVVVVRYADDTVLGFQSQTEADRFREDLRERLGKFGLELHPDKTRRIEFGRYAELNRKRRGEGKPETFDFLGFTHISGKNRKGYFTVKRQTIGQRLRKKLQELKQQLRQRRHEAIARTGKWLRSVVQGYFNYYAVPGNLDSLLTFRARLTRLWRTQLRQRSQRHGLNWERLHRLAVRWLPVPRVLHPWPSVRFAAQHPS
ncbi:MAG: group II intron reverse transcriptase/maturase [Thermoguttaceae bacterium]